MARPGGAPFPPALHFKETWLANLPNSDSSLPDRVLSLALDSDISDFAEPTDLTSHIRAPFYTVQSPLFLQVDEVVDISLPVEERLQLRIRESGTLKILLTDGRIQFLGISKKRLTVLSPTTVPGIKITVLPPIEMRYGVLFLDDDRICIEGGSSPPLIEHREFVFHADRSPRSSGRFLSSEDEGEEIADGGSWVDGEDSDVFVLESEEEAKVGAKSVKEVKATAAIGEIVFVDGKIVDCFDLRVGHRKGKSVFQLLGKIRDDSGEMIVRIEPALIGQAVAIDPEKWANSPPEVKTETFRKCKAFFCGMKPPYMLLKEQGSTDQDRFLLTTAELTNRSSPFD
jgi:hypothetical protein